jgi:hypothetical protein
MKLPLVCRHLVIPEFSAGRESFKRKIEKYCPKVVCFIGKGVYQQYSDRKKYQARMLGIFYPVLFGGNSVTKGKHSRFENAETTDFRGYVR